MLNQDYMTAVPYHKRWPVIVKATADERKIKAVRESS